MPAMLLNLAGKKGEERAVKRAGGSSLSEVCVKKSGDKRGV